MLSLSHQTPVAEGGTRRVFLHPESRDRLVKVVHAGKSPMRGGLRRLLHRFANDADSFVRREASFFRRLDARHTGEHLPVARIDGFLDTDLGRAQVVERIGCGSDLLGPTLQDLRREGPLRVADLALLNDFVARTYRLNLVIRDLKARNLVLGEDVAGRRFVLVDGLGDKNVIPVRTLFAPLNRRHLDRDFARMADRLGLVWRDRQMHRA